MELGVGVDASIYTPLMRRALAASLLLTICCGCREAVRTPTRAQAASLLLITIDTLRADRIGAYGDASARTPAMDGLAARGAMFMHAYATAPITLTSHASMMTGRYPAGHGGRHNGIRIDLTVPTLAERLGGKGFATAAFVAAFPLDRRFGLIKGFQTYGDRMPRGADGRPATNARAGSSLTRHSTGWAAGATGVLPVGPPLRASRSIWRCSNRTLHRTRGTAMRLPKPIVRSLGCSRRSATRPSRL